MTASVKTARRDGDGPDAVVVVKFELPERVVADVREKHDDLDRDAISDRIRVQPFVNGEPV